MPRTHPSTIYKNLLTQFDGNFSKNFEFLQMINLGIISTAVCNSNQHGSESSESLLQVLQLRAKCKSVAKGIRAFFKTRAPTNCCERSLKVFFLPKILVVSCSGNQVAEVQEQLNFSEFMSSSEEVQSQFPDQTYSLVGVVYKSSAESTTGLKSISRRLKASSGALAWFKFTHNSVSEIRLEEELMNLVPLLVVYEKL